MKIIARRVPALKLDDGSPLTENTAILPFSANASAVAHRYAQGSERSLHCRLFRDERASCARPHRRPERYTEDKSAFPESRRWEEVFRRILKQIDAMYAGRECYPTILGARPLRPGVLRLGQKARAARGGAEALHRRQGPHGEAPGGAARPRRRGREAVAVCPAHARRLSRVFHP